MVVFFFFSFKSKQKLSIFYTAHSALWYFHSLSFFQSLKKVNQSCLTSLIYSWYTLVEGSFLLWDWNDGGKDCALSASFVIPPVVFVLILENQERKPGFLSVFLLLVRTNLKERRGRCAVTSTEIQLDSSLMQFALCLQHWNFSEKSLELFSGALEDFTRLKFLILC